MTVYDLAGLVAVGYDGPDSALSSGLERRFSAYRSTAAEPDVLVRVGRVRAPRQMGRARIAVDDGGAYALDRVGRAAGLPLSRACDARVEVRVQDGFDPSELVNRILQPLLRVRLAHTRGVAVVHAAAFDDGDGPTLVCGWSAAGKTASLLARLRAGAAFYGNDWVLLGRDGTVYPYSLQVSLYQRNLADPELVAALGLRVCTAMRAHGAAVRFAGRAARMLRGRAAAGVAELGRLADTSSPHRTSVRELVPGMRIGTPAAVARAVLLSDGEPRAIGPDELARAAAVNLRYESAGVWADALAVSYATGAPNLADVLFEAESGILKDALAGVPCHAGTYRATPGAVQDLPPGPPSGVRCDGVRYNREAGGNVVPAGASLNGAPSETRAER